MTIDTNRIAIYGFLLPYKEEMTQMVMELPIKMPPKITIVQPKTVIEKHISHEAQKHNLDVQDLIYATLTIEYKYWGDTAREQQYARLVENSTEHLWHEAYFCALFAKTYRAEKWPLHIPNMDDVKAVRRDFKRYRK